jgi:hypothetical protein
MYTVSTHLTFSCDALQYCFSMQVLPVLLLHVALLLFFFSRESNKTLTSFVYMGAGYTTSGRSKEECFHLPCAGNNYKASVCVIFCGLLSL